MCAGSGPLPSNVSGTAANGTNFFPALRAMNLSHNAFSGSLPAPFGQSGVFNLKPLQVPLLLSAPRETPSLSAPVSLQGFLCLLSITGPAMFSNLLCNCRRCMGLVKRLQHYLCATVHHTECTKL